MAMTTRLHLDFEVARPAIRAGAPIDSRFVDRSTSFSKLTAEINVLMRKQFEGGEGVADAVLDVAFRVTLSCVRVDLQPEGEAPEVPPVILSQLRLDEAAWRELASRANVPEFLYDALYGATGNLLPAARAQIDWMTNHYEHDACGTAWTDDHSCACDDECPGCGVCISPVESDIREALVEIPGTPGIFGLESERRETAAVDADVNQLASVDEGRPHTLPERQRG